MKIIEDPGFYWYKSNNPEKFLQGYVNFPVWSVVEVVHDLDATVDDDAEFVCLIGVDECIWDVESMKDEGIFIKIQEPQE